ncbi:MAG: hypothetical protein ABIF11_00065 [Nitrospirota bacterium]
MKKLSICFLMVFGLLFFAGIAKVEAGTYLGEFRWRIQCTDGSTATVTLGVTDMGNNHYGLNGLAICPPGPMPVVGNAEIVGGQFLIHLTGSVVDLNRQGYWMEGISFFIKLDLPSFNGNGAMVVTACEINTGYSDIWSQSFTVTLIP